MCTLGKSTFDLLTKVGFLIFFVFLVVTYNFALISTLSELKAIKMAKSEITSVSHIDENVPPLGYLIWNEYCKIPDVDPFTPDTNKLFKPNNYAQCSEELPVTKVVYDLNTRSYVLQIDVFAKRRLIGNNDEIVCCYQSVKRPEANSTGSNYKLEDCVPFYHNYVLSPDVDSVVIICKSEKTQEEVQRDAYCLVPERAEVRQRLESFKRSSNGTRPVSVLMLGMDNLSRFSIRGIMPVTTNQLVKDNWFELGGYNEIDDDTLPNLLALLTGRSCASKECCLNRVDNLENCNFIWDLFRKHGYATAYAEDESLLSNFINGGDEFKKPSVDYYLRPFLLAIEKNFKKQKLSDMTTCIGLRHSTEYIYDYALELATQYRSEPYFGLFWSSTFGQNLFDGASSMDVRMAKYLEEMKQRGVLDDSIVIFFSSHDSRSSRLMYHQQGFLDESLPFVFIWLPTWFQTKYPNFVEALKVNRYRLTNPYDIHMTLKHILELTGRTGKLSQAMDCANCHTLFVPITVQRSCKEIAIEEPWCACSNYENVPSDTPEVSEAVKEVLVQLNSYLIIGNLTPPCQRLKLMTINNAQKKVSLESDSDTEIYRIQFSVHSIQGATFETTVSVSNPGKALKLIGSVSRLDSYEAFSGCISDRTAQKFCLCQIIDRVRNRME